MRHIIEGWRLALEDTEAGIHSMRRAMEMCPPNTVWSERYVALLAGRRAAAAEIRRKLAVYEEAERARRKVTP